MRRNLKIQKASDKEAFSNMIGGNGQNMSDSNNNMNMLYNKEGDK